MKLSEQIRNSQNQAQNQDLKPRPERPTQQQEPAQAESSAIAPAARVEGAKALNLALQKNVQEFGELAQNYEAAATQVAEDISDWMTGALNGENFYSKVLSATARKLQEREEIAIAPVSFEAPKATSLELFETHFGKALGTPKQIGGSGQG